MTERAKAHGSGTRRGWRTRYLAVPLTAIAMLAGSVVAGANPASASTKATGSPVIIGLIAPAGSPILSVPGLAGGANAAARAINAAGGIKGHRVEIDWCNDQDNPNVATQCAQRFVSEKVIATAGDFTLFGSAVVPVLAAAGIPEVGNEALSPAEYTTPSVFLLQGGAYQDVTAAVKLLKSKGVKSYYYERLDNPATADPLVAAQNAGPANGVTYAGSSAIAATASDYDPYVQAAESANAGAVILQLVESQTIQMIQAIQSLGAKLKIVTLSGQLTNSDIAQLGTSGGPADGAYVVGPYPPLSDAAQFPALAQYVKQVAAEYKTGDKNAAPSQERPEALQAWLAVHVIANLMNAGKSSKITAKSVLSAFKSAKNIVTGIIPPWTPNHSIGVAGHARISNDHDYFMQIENGKVVLLKKTPITVF